MRFADLIEEYIFSIFDVQKRISNIDFLGDECVEMQQQVNDSEKSPRKIIEQDKIDIYTVPELSNDFEEDDRRSRFITSKSSLGGRNSITRSRLTIQPRDSIEIGTSTGDRVMRIAIKIDQRFNPMDHTPRSVPGNSLSHEISPINPYDMPHHVIREEEEDELEFRDLRKEVYRNNPPMRSLNKSKESFDRKVSIQEGYIPLKSSKRKLKKRQSSKPSIVRGRKMHSPIRTLINSQTTSAIIRNRESKKKLNSPKLNLKLSLKNMRFKKSSPVRSIKVKNPLGKKGSVHRMIKDLSQSYFEPSPMRKEKSKISQKGSLSRVNMKSTSRERKISEFGPLHFRKSHGMGSKMKSTRRSKSGLDDVGFLDILRGGEQGRLTKLKELIHSRYDGI